MKPNQPSNSICVIFPFKYEGTWVFTDPSTGLDKEPFVSGADVIIDELTKGIPGADSGFKMVFSATAFPGYTARLKWTREEFTGNWYAWEDKGLEGWLCPALFHYFSAAPAELFVKVEARKG